jgi:hypothetical protein
MLPMGMCEERGIGLIRERAKKDRSIEGVDR